MPAGRQRAGIWLDVARGTPGAPSVREALVRMAPWSMQDRVRRRLGPPTVQVAEQLVTPPLDAGGEPIGKRLITLQTTWCCDIFNMHYSRLAAGRIPHEIHEHDEEELLIPISGEVEIVKPEGATAIGPGWLVYHSSSSPHTIRATGAEDATYLVLRWSGTEGDSQRRLPASILPMGAFLEEGLRRGEQGESLKHAVLMAKPVTSRAPTPTCQSAAGRRHRGARRRP